MKVLRRENGQVLIFTALIATVLLGFVAFAVDVGLPFRTQRNMQIAADAAAVAAALDFKYNASISSAESAGATASTANGFTSGTNGATVSVTCPPADGPNAGTVGYCEALVSQPNSTYFMKIFTHNATTVSARAVAGAGLVQGCLWTLATSGVDVSISGSGSINTPTCPVYDDSNASDALDLSGSGSISAEEIGIVGNDPGYKDSGSGSINICSPNCSTHNPTTGIAPAASPIDPTSPPVPTGTSPSCSGTSAACNPSCSSSSSCAALQPGTYTSITNSGSGSWSLAPGNYNVTGSITNSGSGSLSLGAGNYVVNGSISNSASGKMTLGAGNYIINTCLCDTGSGNMTTGAGDYTMGTFTSSGSSSISLGSGLYITTGNMSLTGSGGISGSSVTFFDEGSTSLGGSGSMNLTAPTSGTYNGIVLFQPTTDTNSVTITGSGSMTMEGIVYVPKSGVTLSGSGSGNIYLDFIADSLTLSGSGSFTDKQYQLVNASALMQRVTLVE